MQCNLRLKAQLGLNTYIHQNIRIIIPAPDAIQITGAALVIDDEGNNAMPEAFFEHNQAAYTAIAVFIGADAFELHVKVQYVLKVNGFLRFVLLD